MRVKKVPLQDLELWPDEVICFTAYTDTRNPVQQRRTYVDGEKLKAENAELRADLQASEHVINQVANAGFDVNSENEKLREYTNELLRVVKLGEIDCGACRHFDECYAGDAMDFAPENCRLVVYARELGIEVPE